MATDVQCKLTHEFESSEFPRSGLGDVDRIGANVAMNVATRDVKERECIGQL